MNTKSTNQPGRPVLQRAAETGLYLGGYLSLLALATGLSQSAPAASLLVWAGSIALPFALYVLLRRSLAERDFSATFTEVWLEGIASFFFGSMIQAVIIYLGLRFLAPHYLLNSVEMAIDYFNQMGTPAGDQWARTLTDIREHNGIPTAVDVVSQIISMNLIGGTFITLIDASILKARYSSEARRQAWRNRHNSDYNGR